MTPGVDEFLILACDGVWEMMNTTQGAYVGWVFPFAWCWNRLSRGKFSADAAVPVSRVLWCVLLGGMVHGYKSIEVGV